MAIDRSRFTAQLKKFRRMGLDSSIPIYHLEDVAPYSELTEVTFAAVAKGSLTAILSTVAVTELLVKPFAAGQSDRVAAFERFVESFGNLILAAPTYAVCKEAARLRGKYGIRTPDALLIATTLGDGAEAFMTNDEGLRRLKSEGITIVVLADYI